MVRLFYGSDTYAAREEIGRLAKEIGASIRWLDRVDLEGKSFSDWAAQSSGLFGRDLPIVRDPGGLLKDMQEQLAEAADLKVDAVLWQRGKVDKRTQLWQAYRKQAREFADAEPGALVQWLIKKAEEGEGFSIERQAAGVMVQWLGADKWRLLSELERLQLQQRKVTAELVEREVARPAMADVFAVMDALTVGDKRRAVGGVEELLAQGHNEFYVLSMLERNFRILALVQQGKRRGLSDQELARAAKLHPFVVQKTGGAAGRISAEKSAEGLTRVAATDFAIKQGRSDARTAVMMLTAGLADLCRR